MRYVIFGCRRDRLVEHKAATLHVAKMLAALNSDCGYKPRIWDKRSQAFVRHNNNAIK